MVDTEPEDEGRGPDRVLPAVNNTVHVSAALPKVDPPGEINLTGDREENFRRFKSRWTSYAVLARLNNETEEFQRSLLLYCAGPEAARVVESSARYVTDKSCDAILQILEQYCVGERNVIHERYRFNSRNQRPGESFDSFYTEIRALAAKCKYDYLPSDAGSPSPADEMLRDRIVLGIQNDGVRKKLISKGSTLTLVSAVNECRSAELTSSAMKEVSGSGAASSVDAVYKKKNKFTKAPSNKSSVKSVVSQGQTSKLSYAKGDQCGRCGKSPHSKALCPAKDAACRACKKKGHYEKMCRSRAINEVSAAGEESDEFLFTGELHIGEASGWTAEINVNDRLTKFKLDTGADGTVLSDRVPWLVGMTLTKPKTSLYGPGRNQLTVVGTFQAKLSYRDKSVNETIYVVRNQQQSLLSRSACQALELVTCNVGEVNTDAKTEFPELFKGLGCLKKFKYQITLKDDVKPTCIYVPRSVPFPLEDKVRNKLEEMKEKGVISPVQESTDWCSGLVVVEKPNGDVRLCVDLTGLNAAVKREVHPMSSVDESLARLRGSKVFTKLDANSGFWQMPLSEESRPYTTFLTPFGRFWFNRLPFGITSAPEIF
jgi:hypothetical protein